MPVPAASSQLTESHMEEVELGNTGRVIHRVGLGGMQLSVAGRPDRAEAIAVIRRAVELGIDFIDTADVYCTDDEEIGHNERLIRDALSEMDAAHDIVVATKAGMTRPGGRWERDGRPEHIRAACERSLRALGVESIDLYQFHTPDPRVPFLDSVGAFARLRSRGLVAAVGLSNVTLDQVRDARQLVPVCSVQNHYNPWDLSWEKAGLVEYCDSAGITFLPYSPLGGRQRSRLLSESTELRAIASRVGATPAELTLAWILARSPSLVIIPSASRLASVESSVRAGSVTIDAALDAELRQAFRHLPGQLSLTDRVVAMGKRLLGL
jgi:aryl-alcohol dehydrogenase-like predicted oxidoreductase